MGQEYDECDEPHYVGEENTLFYVDCGIDVSASVGAKVFLQRPDGTVAEKTATPTIYNGSPDFVFFRVARGDFNQAGKYSGQVWMQVGAWSGWGRPFAIEVDAPISSSSSSSSSLSSSSSCRSSSSSSKSSSSSSSSSST